MACDLTDKVVHIFCAVERHVQVHHPAAHYKVLFHINELRKRQKNQCCGKNAADVKPTAYGKSDTCTRPQSCCRCQPFDPILPVRQYGSGPQKTDSADYLRAHTGRIPARPVG